MTLFCYSLHLYLVSPAFFYRFHYPCSLLYVSALMLNPNNPTGLGIHPYPSMSCIEAICHVGIIRVLKMDVISVPKKSCKCDEWSRCKLHSKKLQYGHPKSLGYLKLRTLELLIFNIRTYNFQYRITISFQLLLTYPFNPF